MTNSPAQKAMIEAKTILGLVDDALIIPAGIWIFLKMLPEGLFEEHRAVAEAAAERPRSKGGMVLIVLIWIAAAILLWRLLAWNYA